jgi:hypothetical protein
MGRVSEFIMRQDDPFWEEAEAAPGRPRRFRPRRPRRKLSAILLELAHDASRERVAIADLMRAMDGRAFGALLLVFAIPNALPAIPGTSGILGLPLLYLAAQMMLGRAPHLPKLVSERAMGRAEFAVLVERINPWLARADRLTAPRLQWLVDSWVERVVGAWVLVLAIVLVLPIPFGNMLPAFAICLVALGVLERDGLWVLGGVVAGALGLWLASSVIYLLARGAWLLAVNILAG